MPGEITTGTVMHELSPLGWSLIAIGLVLAILGGLFVLSPQIPWLGRLPGDLRWESGNVRVYFPIATCIVISLLLSAAMWLWRWWETRG